MANAEKLRAVLEHIKSDLKHWQQDAWFEELYEWDEDSEMPVSCGTACCFAGWTCIMYGWERVMHDSGFLSSWKVQHPELGAMEAGEAAQRELELTQFEANLLFQFDSTLEKLESLVEKIIAGEHKDMN